MGVGGLVIRWWDETFSFINSVDAIRSFIITPRKHSRACPPTPPASESRLAGTGELGCHQPNGMQTLLRAGQPPRILPSLSSDADTT